MITSLVIKSKDTWQLNQKSNFEYLIKYDLNKQAKPFWKNCKPYFSNKLCKADASIMLNENGELVMKNQDNANTFNDYFRSIVKNLNLFQWNEQW